MTKSITFNFTNPSLTKPQATGVSLNHSEIKSSDAKKSMEEMNALMGRLMSRLKEKTDEKSQDGYEKIRNCTQFTVSIELPPEGEKHVLKIEDAANKWRIILPLAHETASSLNLRSLVQLPSAPPRLSPTLTQAMSTSNPTAIIHADVPEYKKNEPKKVVKTSPTPTPPQGLISRFFAWILSFFSTSQTPPAITEKSPLVYHTNPASYSPAPAQGVAGIRPLRNGNNICFINAIFQALMNIPEMKKTLIAAHEKKIARDDKMLKELAGLIAAAETALGTAQKQLQEVTKNYAWYQYLLPDAEYTKVYGLVQKKYSALSTLQKEQQKVQASKQASITLNEAISKYDQQSTYLNELRGFIEGSTWQQEDACELLDRIFEPLDYLLDHQIETTPEVLASLKRIMFDFGEEKQLEPYQPKDEEESKQLASDLASTKDPSLLPLGGIVASLANSLIVRSDIPADKAKLQDLLETQLTMQEPSQQDNLAAYINNGQKRWYQVKEKQLAIRTLDKIAPEFVTIQLKRFRVNSDRTTSKIDTEIEIPQDGKVVLTVNGYQVTYEIQTLVQHSGYTLSGGHYFSYVRKEGSWVEANDTTVAKLDKLPSSTPSQAYLIFLKRV